MSWFDHNGQISEYKHERWKERIEKKLNKKGGKTRNISLKKYLKQRENEKKAEGRS